MVRLNEPLYNKTPFLIGILIITTYPAKNIKRNHDPGTAKQRIASSVSLSSDNLQGIQASISKFDIKNMAFAGELY